MHSQPRIPRRSPKTNRRLTASNPDAAALFTALDAEAEKYIEEGRNDIITVIEPLLISEGDLAKDVR